METMQIGEQWKALGERASRSVVIINLDLSGSSLVPKAFPHDWDVGEKVNSLQDKISDTIQGPEWFVGEWSGDGLVALYLDALGETDAPVGTALQLLDIVEQWRVEQKKELGGQPEGKKLVTYLDEVGVRIGVCRGEIIWRSKAPISTGRIISQFMNTAGHLQKECEPGSVMIDEETRNRLRDLKTRFPESASRTIVHGTTKLTAYPCVESLPPGEPDKLAPIETRIIERLGDCQTITKAPGACYFFGEFAVMFGHVALIQPVPRYLFVGIKHEPSAQQMEVTLAAGLAVKPGLDLHTQSSLDALRLPDDFEEVGWSANETERITRLVVSRVPQTTGRISITVISLIPNRCGLNSSSALSMALAAALLPNTGTAIERVGSCPPNNPIHIESDDSVSRLVKFAWELDNVFHLEASSGCGVTAALLGSEGGWPLVYFAESRSFQGPYPIVFNGSPHREETCDLLRRIRAVALRTKGVERLQGSLHHEYAIFHTTPRAAGEGTGDIIRKFLSAKEVAGDVTAFIKTKLQKINPQGHKFYLSTNFLARALRLEGYETRESFHADPEPIPRLKEMLVESFANALGVCSVAGTSAFVNPYFQLAEWTVFANCMNAYQELMCACGMSKPLANLFNYRSDAFSHIFGKERHPFGSKLTGAGRGGDFVVVAPNTDLSAKFETFRHEVKIDRRLLPCHFTSWHASGPCPGVTVMKGGN